MLDRLGQSKISARVPPRDARWFVFRAASAANAPRDQVLREVATTLGVSAGDLESALFADLQGERRVGELPRELSPSQLALHVNQAIIGSLLRRAARVRITAWGNTRALVRHARLLGLICVVTRPANTKAKANTVPPTFDILRNQTRMGIMLDISGPFALFRRTEVYGRALASLVPRAARCNQFEIEAACALGRGAHLSTFVVRSGDPISPGRELKEHDSKVEERFARDFRRAAPEWDVIREPRPVETEGTLVFPDFELVHRRDPGRRWLLEIVGYWTEEYLTEKLRRLSAAGLEHLVLCIDQNRRCSEAELPVDARIVRYKSRIDPRAVLAIVDPPPTSRAP